VARSMPVSLDGATRPLLGADQVTLPDGQQGLVENLPPNPSAPDGISKPPIPVELEGSSGEPGQNALDIGSSQDKGTALDHASLQSEVPETPLDRQPLTVSALKTDRLLGHSGASLSPTADAPLSVDPEAQDEGGETASPRPDAASQDLVLSPQISMLQRQASPWPTNYPSTPAGLGHKHMTTTPARSSPRFVTLCL
jgi:hypothetical protein